ncbi:hypothetical protein AB0L74_28740 [Streptomyces sp. NPDC052020]|uniref:hypothetical protein n=1 Tax=Streptomyces sp. NPDC052020 TaxID=3155677 RepID=UPI00344214ED
MTTGTRPARSLETGPEPERTPGRREARTRLRSELWRHDPREMRKNWFRPAGPDGRDPTPEGS